MCSYESSQLLCLWKPRALYQATSNTSEQSCGHFFPKCRQQTALEKERDGSTSSNVSVPRAHWATGLPPNPYPGGTPAAGCPSALRVGFSAGWGLPQGDGALNPGHHQVSNPTIPKAPAMALCSRVVGVWGDTAPLRSYLIVFFPARVYVERYGIAKTMFNCRAQSPSRRRA